MANQLPQWLIDLQTALPGELPGDHIARIATSMEGCSLSHNRDKLNELFLVNELDLANATRVAAIQTNCATFCRAVLALAGCENKHITTPYKIGEAVSDVLLAGIEMSAAIDCHANPNAWQNLDTGWIIRYETPGTQNDHIEICLSKPDPNTGMTNHIGGGRPANTIGPLETTDIRHSLGRPIAHIINPNKLGIPTGQPLPTPNPDPIVIDPGPSPTPDPNPQPSPNPIQPVQSNTSILDMIFQFIASVVKWFLSWRK